MDFTALSSLTTIFLMGCLINEIHLTKFPFDQCHLSSVQTRWKLSVKGVTTSRATSGDRKNDPNTSGQR